MNTIEISAAEMIKSLQKGNKKILHEYFTQFKVDHLSVKSDAESKDQFAVNLVSLSDDDLIQLHRTTNWVAPSYFLHFRHLHGMADISDDTLFVLAQTGSHTAKKTLIQRYEHQLTEASDEVLVLMVQEDNTESLEVLINRYVPFVKKIIRRLERKFFFRGYDSGDLFQEGILGLFKAKDDYKIERKTKFKDFSKHVIEKHIGTLILRSSNYKNKVLNESFSYHSPIGSDSEITFEQLLKTDANLPEETCANLETFRDIWKKLTPLERGVLKLYALGLSYEEIGQSVGKPKKAIDNTIQRIRKKGKDYVDAHLKKQ